MAKTGFDEEIYQAMMGQMGKTRPTQTPDEERAREMQALGMSGVGGIMQRGDLSRPVAEMVNNGTIPQTVNDADIIKAILNSTASPNPRYR